ncbi:hypothetical protein KP509_34G053500 [Ceratopteris richardii]|uniref:Glycosyltransferase n=1 Tax=Ceratopteris richardii TaxID=49495 RepID=A0A8T2QL72_CERRI|nr:hypothetical protein KP509_34G053500 [Ceratopteris richardii]
MATSDPHAVVFPFPTQGHINPLSFLAKLLLDAGIDVTFVHSQTTYSMLQKRLQTELVTEEESCDRSSARSRRSSNLYVEVIQDDVPTNNDGTRVGSSLALFMSSIPTMQKNFESLLQRLMNDGRRPSCIISDSFLPWTQDVAAQFRIPRIEFWSSTATVYSMGFSIPKLLSEGHVPLPPEANMELTIDIAPGVGPCRRADFFYDIMHETVTSSKFHFLQDAFSRGRESQRVVVHSMHHLEEDVIEALRKEGIPMDPIGPLLDIQIDRGASSKVTHYKELDLRSLLEEDEHCMEWLDLQTKASVIYVSFGSNAKISSKEMLELALGLEDSQHPFLLVVRPDLVPNMPALSIFPDNFIERNDGRAWISSWVPQSAVLAHPSIGGFLSHCGWNSVMESLCMGVPLIGCPHDSEQNTNMKCLLDWKAGIAVDSNQPQVKIKRELVATAIRTLMNEPEGIIVKRRIMELKEAARFAIQIGQSRTNLEKLVDDIKKMALGEYPNFLHTSPL